MPIPSLRRFLLKSLVPGCTLPSSVAITLLFLYSFLSSYRSPPAAGKGAHGVHAARLLGTDVVPGQLQEYVIQGGTVNADGVDRHREIPDEGGYKALTALHLEAEAFPAALILQDVYLEILVQHPLG